jgi:predicted solute-binding protein
VRFAYRKEFATEALAAALERRGWRTIPTDSPGEMIVEGTADIALTPTLEYAQRLGIVDYALVPGLAIITAGFAGLLRLVFNKGLVSIDTLAVKNPKSSEALVAQVVLSEKYDIEPKLVSMPADAGFAEMIGAADAALLVGDDAIFETHGNRSLLDLSDEWEDILELPLPYMLAWGRVDEIPEYALVELLQARDEAVLTLADRAAVHPHAAEAHAFYQRYLLGDVRYTLEESDLTALDAFFRLAFFRLAVADIPSLKYLPHGEPAEAPPQGPPPASPDSTTSPS